MRDVIVKKLANTANEIYKNLDKEAHIQDVVRRLAHASEMHPHDQVIRHMEDVFQKRAKNNPHKIVSGEEFEQIRQSLWGLNPRSAIKEFFPDLSFDRIAEQELPTERVFGNEAARNIVSDKTPAQIMESARELILNALSLAGVGHAQTRFARSLFSNYDNFGQPTDGVLMFQANVITKAGDVQLIVPVIMTDGQLVSPDHFANNTNRYPLTKKGISDFSLGLDGIAFDHNIEDVYVFAENEVRYLPTVDNSAQDLINDATIKIVDAFKDSGVNNCQVKFASFDLDENESSGTMKFNVRLPFVAKEITVPVTIDNSMVYSPFNFATEAGREFSLTQNGVGQFIAENHSNDVTGIASRIAGEVVVREKNENKTDFRGIISQKLAADLKKFGASNPQVFFVTSSENNGNLAAAFISTFASAKGQCQIAIPITIAGRSVKAPKHFVGENEKCYDFNSAGLNNYIASKNDFQPIKSNDFYGEYSPEKIAQNELDSNAKTISRQEGFESKSRVISPKDSRQAKQIENIRRLLATDLKSFGARNPQIFFDKQNNNILRFSATFSSGKGIKKASIPVMVTDSGLVKPTKFAGDDNSVYEFSPSGVTAFIAASEAPANAIEEKITSKLSIMSFDKLRSFAKEAFHSGEAQQLSAAMTSISDRFGEDAAKNCFFDLTLEAKIKTNSQNKCVGCPFFQSGKDKKSRTATDSCLKFQTCVSNVKFGGHHSRCTLVKRAAEEPSFDGAIVESQIKLT